MLNNTSEKNPKEQGSKGFIYRRYIVKNGRRIYPKKAKAFKIPVADIEQ